MKKHFQNFKPDWSSYTPIKVASNGKLLLVDADFRELRKTRVAFMKGMGFTVYPATRIEDAVLRCKPGKFDLIVVNATAPAEQALEVCDQIRKNDPHQPLLLIVAGDRGLPRRDFIVADSAEAVNAKAKAMFRRGRAESIAA
jgi:CheY-like chemotaxis protein